MTKSNITDSHSLLRRNLVLTVCRRTTRLNQHKRRGVYVISVTWFLSSQGIIKEIGGEEIGSICEQKNVKKIAHSKYANFISKQSIASQ